MFDIELTADAIEDLRGFKKNDRPRILDEMERQLAHEPTRETRNRKKLRPNKLAEWELRLDKFRIFYDVDTTDEIVKIAAVGFKQGNRLFIHGEEYEL